MGKSLAEKENGMDWLSQGDPSEKMSKKPIDILMDRVDWKPTDVIPQDEGLYATHEGILWIEDFDFRVFILNDGSRIILKTDVEKFFGIFDDVLKV